MVIGFAPVVVNTGKELVLFDTGNGAARRPDAGRLASLLATAGFQPEQIDVVVLSHFHPDHVGGLMEKGRPLLPNARYVTAAAEYDFWSPKERLSGPTERVATLVQANVVPLAENMTFIKEGAEVVSGIEALDASGHTPGHMVFHIESAGKRLVVTADTANHFVLALQRPDWHVRFDMDKEQATASRRRIFDLIATERIPFSGYHCRSRRSATSRSRTLATATCQGVSVGLVIARRRAARLSFGRARGRRPPSGRARTVRLARRSGLAARCRHRRSPRARLVRLTLRCRPADLDLRDCRVLRPTASARGRLYSPPHGASS